MARAKPKPKTKRGGTLSVLPPGPPREAKAPESCASCHFWKEERPLTNAQAALLRDVLGLPEQKVERSAPRGNPGGMYEDAGIFDDKPDTVNEAALKGTIFDDIAEDDDLDDDDDGPAFGEALVGGPPALPVVAGFIPSLDDQAPFVDDRTDWQLGWDEAEIEPALTEALRDRNRLKALLAFARNQLRLEAVEEKRTEAVFKQVHEQRTNMEARWRADLGGGENRSPSAARAEIEDEGVVLTEEEGPIGSGGGEQRLTYRHFNWSKSPRDVAWHAASKDYADAMNKARRTAETAATLAHVIEPGDGLCRRYAPSGPRSRVEDCGIFGSEEILDDSNRWPTTTSTDYCGEYKRKEP